MVDTLTPMVYNVAMNKKSSPMASKYRFQCDTCVWGTDNQSGVKLHATPGHTVRDLGQKFSVTMHIDGQADRTYVVTAFDEWKARATAQLARGRDSNAPRLDGQLVNYTVVKA